MILRLCMERAYETRRARLDATYDTYREDHEAFSAKVHDCPVEFRLVSEERNDRGDHARRGECDC